MLSCKNLLQKSSENRNWTPAAVRYPTRKSEPAPNTARTAAAAPKWTWMAPDHPQPASPRQTPPDRDAQPRATADAPGRPPAAPSDCCSEPRRNRQLWGAFAVSSNNDAKVPLKQMTKFLGNSTYKVSLKKTLGGWQKFCLMKIDIYSFM